MKMIKIEYVGAKPLLVLHPWVNIKKKTNHMTLLRMSN